MVRDLRIKEYKFSTTNLTAVGSAATALGSETISAYSTYPINGTIQMVEFVAGNYNPAGSIGIFVSGTNENIMTITSGINGYLGANQALYPFAYTTSNVNTSIGIGSLTNTAQRVINSNLGIWGSGLGTGSTASGLNIKYI